MRPLSTSSDLQAMPLDLLPVGALLLAPDGTLLCANGILCTLLGRAGAALEGSLVGTFFTPDDARDLRQLLEDSPRGEVQTVRGALESVAGPLPVIVSWTLAAEARHRDAAADPAGEAGAANVLVLFTPDSAGDLTTVPAFELAGSPTQPTRPEPAPEPVGSLQLGCRVSTWSASASGMILSFQHGHQPSNERLGAAFLGQSVFDLLHPEDVPAALETWQQALSPDAGRAEYACRTLDAQGRWVRARLTVVDRRDASSVGAVIGSITVVDAERGAENRRAESHASAFASFEQPTLAQVLLDERGLLQSVNSAFCRLLQRESSELIGLNLSSLAHAEDKVGADKLARVLRGDDGSCQVRLMLTPSSGEALLVRADVTCFPGTGGAPGAVSLVLHDVSALDRREQLRLQQAAFVTTMNCLAGDLALIADSAGQVVYVSPGVIRVLGYDSEALVGLGGWDFVHPDDAEASQASFAAVVADGVSRSGELRIRAADGSWRWMEGTVVKLLEEAVGDLACNLRDVHEQKLARQQLHQSEAKFHAIAEAADQGIWAVSSTGATLFANVRMATLLGRPVQELYHLSAESLAFAEPALLAERRQLRSERGPGYEVLYEHPELGARVFWVCAAPFPATEGSVLGSVTLVSDVTESRRTERELERLALHDSLTGIANRALFLDRLEQSLARMRSTTAVLLIDLDFFKLVNDSLGHAVGDELLVAVARALVAAVRSQDTVARLGGDEFVVLVEDVTQAQALELGQSILVALSMLADSGGEVRSASASIGLAMGPGSAGDVLRYADTAMYAAKPGSTV